SAQIVRSRFASQRTTTAAGKFRRQLDSLRFAPETFEVVELPCLLLKHMHDKIAVVQKNPFGSLVTFHTRRRMARLLQSLVCLIRNCLHLTFVCTTHNYKVIREAGDLAQIEDNWFDGLLLPCSVKCSEHTLVEAFSRHRLRSGPHAGLRI